MLASQTTGPAIKRLLAQRRSQAPDGGPFEHYVDRRGGETSQWWKNENARNKNKNTARVKERLHSHFRWRAQPKRMSCSVGLFMGRGCVYTCASRYVQAYVHGTRAQEGGNTHRTSMWPRSVVSQQGVETRRCLPWAARARRTEIRRYFPTPAPLMLAPCA